MFLFRVFRLPQFSPFETWGFFSLTVDIQVITSAGYLERCSRQVARRMIPETVPNQVSAAVN
jgi:hypothetical protein